MSNKKSVSKKPAVLRAHRTRKLEAKVYAKELVKIENAGFFTRLKWLFTGVKLSF